MDVSRRAILGAGLGAAAWRRAGAQVRTPPVRIGVLTDLSGPYAGIAGQGSVACVRQAVREFGTAFEIQVVSADHRNDAATGAAIAHRWYMDEHVDLIIDVPNSDVALAVNAVAREANKAYVNCGAGSVALTGSACSPNTIHWSYDTRMLARSTGGAAVHAGGTTWFFVVPDYTFGHEVQAATARDIVAAGGRIEGTAAYRFPGTVDFRPQLRAAAQSGAQVLGLANAGADVTACVQQAREIGVADSMRIACLLMQIPDVHHLGLDNAAGLMLTESFYWDLNDRTRAFTARLVAAEAPATYPDMIQAGCYAGTWHFLKSVAAMGVANARGDGASLVARMKATPTDDDAFGAGSIRGDGRGMFPGILFQVKSRDESSGPWDYYRQVASTPAELAYGMMSSGGCVIGAR